MVTTELTQDEVFLRRFRREVEAAQRIEHENVVPVLAHGEEGGLPYLVQALIPGGSLAERIQSTGEIGLAETLRMLGQAAAGIDALHAGGLVHRDIKPANILLDGETAYVSDFGLAKDSQASNLTRPGQALGSLDYMAPEQIRGEEVSPGHRHLRARLRVHRVADRRAAVRRAPEHARAVRPPAGPAAGPDRAAPRIPPPRRAPSAGRWRRSPRSARRARRPTSPASRAPRGCDARRVAGSPAGLPVGSRRGREHAADRNL